jgi:hypothetical protein
LVVGRGAGFEVAFRRQDRETAVRKPVESAGPGVAAVALLAACLGGCQDGKFNMQGGWPTTAPHGEVGAQQIPSPINLLLPKAVRIHPFTGTRTFDQAGGVKGIDVRIEALDGYGDPTKAFGQFYFALHQYVPGNADPKGKLIASWKEDIMEPNKNFLHWDNITRTYEFKLQWYRAIPVGNRFVLAVSFTSPFTERKFAERVFVSGQ